MCIITVSAVKTTAKLCQEKQPQKSKKPSASVRRRRKKRRSESSNDSEDEKLPEPSYKRQRIFINSTSSADTPADSSSKTEPVPKTLQNERIISWIATDHAWKTLSAVIIRDAQLLGKTGCFLVILISLENWCCFTLIVEPLHTVLFCILSHYLLLLLNLRSTWSY